LWTFVQFFHVLEASAGLVVAPIVSVAAMTPRATAMVVRFIKGPWSELQGAENVAARMRATAPNRRTQTVRRTP
jgi:hypothetical protein